MLVDLVEESNEGEIKEQLVKYVGSLILFRLKFSNVIFFIKSEADIVSRLVWAIISSEFSFMRNLTAADFAKTDSPVQLVLQRQGFYFATSLQKNNEGKKEPSHY